MPFPFNVDLGRFLEKGEYRTIPKSQVSKAQIDLPQWPARPIPTRCIQSVPSGPQTPPSRKTKSQKKLERLLATPWCSPASKFRFPKSYVITISCSLQPSQEGRNGSPDSSSQHRAAIWRPKTMLYEGKPEATSVTALTPHPPPSSSRLLPWPIPSPS